ncbi:MAG TPA: ATP-binding protein [Terriglobales bacterium]|nr:ATP-binding protein [Terriglobales bacterium]
MQETKQDANGMVPAARVRYGLGTKLIVMLLGGMLVIFSLLGYLTIRLQRQHMEMATLLSAERISDVIRRNTTEYMLHNDREGLHRAISAMANEPGVVRLRVFDREGRISYSSEAPEIDQSVDKDAEACYGCHAQQQPLAHLNRPDRFRIYPAKGERVLAIITPIENQANCSNASCHAHPANQQILGVLDTHLSLARTDQQLAELSWRVVVCDGLAMAATAILSWIFIRRVVDRPLKRLQEGTERLTEGALGIQIKSSSHDELGLLADSFNVMSLQLRAANEEVVAWARTLEDRVDEKTRELRRAHDEVLHVETMSSVGKMAAVVAHEINNPLSGILTYSKLIKKWVDNGQVSAEKKQEAQQCLDLISSESKRCGELVKNLLSFSRQSPMNVQSTDLNRLVGQTTMLVRPNLKLAAVELHTSLAEGLPLLHCDPSQIEQVLLAVIVNAADAMPKGGNLWVESRLSQDSNKVVLTVRDDGSGIPPEILPKIFEPFVTTKETGRGTGLGLAVSRGIIERHSGQIKIDSEVGKGTTVTITLPVPSRSTTTMEPANSMAGTEMNTR